MFGATLFLCKLWCVKPVFLQYPVKYKIYSTKYLFFREQDTCVSLVSTRVQYSCVSPVSTRVQYSCVSLVSTRVQYTCVSPVSTRVQNTCVSPVSTRVQETWIPERVLTFPRYHWPSHLKYNKFIFYKNWKLTLWKHQCFKEKSKIKKFSFHKF